MPAFIVAVTMCGTTMKFDYIYLRVVDFWIGFESHPKKTMAVVSDRFNNYRKNLEGNGEKYRHKAIILRTYVFTIFKPFKESVLHDNNYSVSN